jgi:hypothetical protein
MSDDRIIDLDKSCNLPSFFNELPEPVNLTLCTGDGYQDYITDIEWFTTGKPGHNRETKPTTIFMTTKNYSSEPLEMNKKYLRDHPELKVILLVYDHTKNTYKENLVKLFPNKINNIFEDDSCYGAILDIKTLYGILKENGKYKFEKAFIYVTPFISGLHMYDEYLKYFNIDLQKGEIVKDNSNILTLPSKKNIPIGEDVQTTNNYRIWKTNPKQNMPAFQNFLHEFIDFNEAIDTYQLRIKKREKVENCQSDKDCENTYLNPDLGANGKCNLEKHMCVFDGGKGKGKGKGQGKGKGKNTYKKLINKRKKSMKR